MVDTLKWIIQDDEDYNSQAINQAAALLKQGQTVAFPTETVYGLGADATNSAAVLKIFEAKGRPQDNPLIAHVATLEQLTKLVDNIQPYVKKLIDTFSPGPITYVLPSNGVCAENVTAGLSTIGVRIPDHPVAQALLRNCDIPIAAPSANISGKPSPTTAYHVFEDLQGKIAGILDGGATGVGVESTVIDCTEAIPTILRPGGITVEQLQSVVGDINVDPALVSATERPKAPGMKYRHYSPEVPLWLVQGTSLEIQQVIDKEQANGVKIAVLASASTAKQLRAEEIFSLGDNMNEIAAHLYDALRKYKSSDVDLIVCEAFSEVGIGQAVMNRLKKAASKYMEN
ncbi:threonylcarbamoyl-AMP synthase [Oceanobacillus sp. 143]|uniref:Threonylcarbamoyl-AMP synthase n=1 Tax=Oceanobacillus zhaokaii TaxID=2052660 RepID=A0A345PKV9_9BACI|nr:L-threonylcarbamoyladenylate synthase [Oceanobacillus zhaokaii]AXI10639.1 threonylcarbamoyl-AMP synthase [Oceanobacillus zhaokaii]QGS69974.1 threonylcarbamoyl-AMP synthase [Oceanobacillus sp. 143]